LAVTDGSFEGTGYRVLSKYRISAEKQAEKW